MTPKVQDIYSYEELLSGDRLLQNGWFGWKLNFDLPFLFRRGPAPRQGLSRSHRGSYLRHPHTRAAHRAAEFFRVLCPEDDLYVDHTLARLAAKPTDYDDLPRYGGHAPRTWKRHRRTQHKPIVSL